MSWSLPLLCLAPLPCRRDWAIMLDSRLTDPELHRDNFSRNAADNGNGAILILVRPSRDALAVGVRLHPVSPGHGPPQFQRDGFLILFIEISDGLVDLGRETIIGHIVGAPGSGLADADNPVTGTSLEDPAFIGRVDLDETGRGDVPIGNCCLRHCSILTSKY